MTERGCFIGNSHVACVKDALSIVDAPFRDDATFFYSPRETLRLATVIDGAIKSPRSNVRSVAGRPVARGTIRLADHDFFVLTGLGLSILALAVTYRKHRLLEHKENDAQLLISRDCLTAIAVDRIDATLALHIGRMIRPHTDCPIYVVPQPCLSEVALATDSDLLRSQRIHNAVHMLTQGGSGRFLFDLFVSECKDLCRREGLIFVPQPDATLAFDCLTKAEYQLRPDEFLHGNRSYGLKVLHAIQRLHVGKVPQ